MEEQKTKNTGVIERNSAQILEIEKKLLFHSRLRTAIAVIVLLGAITVFFVLTYSVGVITPKIDAALDNLTTLTQNLTEISGNIETTVKGIDVKELSEAVGKLKDVDIKRLNESINALADVIEPLAKVMGAFKK